MSGQSNSVISAFRLSKWYGMVMGLNNVSLKMGQGVTGLLGPNGAGKSTFLKLMTGQMKASQGDLRVFGQPVWNNPELMGRLGYCPEQDAFYHWMSGLEFVSTLLQIGGLQKKDALDQAESALKVLDMGKAMDRKISGYSKGMRQRVKIAQAIAHDPDLLILDEPLSGTDPVGRVKIIEVVKKMASEGKDIIVSSHVLHDVERITKQIVLINKGRVIAQGNIHDIRGLIDQHPHIVKIKTTEARRLAALLAENPTVVSMEISEEGLTVKTNKPDLFYAQLPAVITENKLSFTELTSPDDNLDAVFRYLVEG
jgi:ABC-2 type transport system ATP-binding protein